MLRLVKTRINIASKSGEIMLKTQSLVFEYNQHTSFQFPDINLEAGSDLLILGESGVGKTTLLHLIAGLIRPKSGSIELCGDTTS